MEPESNQQSITSGILCIMPAAFRAGERVHRPHTVCAVRCFRRFFRLRVPPVPFGSRCSADVRIRISRSESGFPSIWNGKLPSPLLLQASFRNAFRLRSPGYQLYGIVICDELILELGHFDVPGRFCVVNQRRIASPAVRIVML